MASTGIEQFQDLTLTGTTEQLDQIKAFIVEALAPPWSHAPETEKELGRGSTSTVLVAHRTQTKDIPAARLFLFRSEHAWSVGNIVPSLASSMTKSQYNSILNDFRVSFVQPAAERLHFNVNVTADHQSLEDWLPAEAARALRAFSSSANKSTGSSHPLDRARWFAFLALAYGHTKHFDSSRLMQWLVDIERWPEDEASDLAIEYEFGLGLIEYVKTHA